MFQDKEELRKSALNKRKLSAKSGLTALNSSRIVSKILNSDDFISARHVGLYYPIKNETDLRGLLNVKDKTFYLPDCDENNEIFFIKYEGENSLIEGKFKIKTPKGVPVDPSVLDVIYIPALMANPGFYRLGYGKGCYDRFFQKNKGILKAKKLIVTQKEFISEQFVPDPFDVKCDGIICE